MGLYDWAIATEQDEFSGVIIHMQHHPDHLALMDQLTLTVARNMALCLPVLSKMKPRWVLLHPIKASLQLNVPSFLK